MRILLVHTDPAWGSRLQQELGEDVLTTATTAEALQTLTEGGVDLVVAHDKVDVAFLEELSRRAPETPRAILLNGGDRRAWLEAAAEGHRFTAVPELAPDVAVRLAGLVRPEPALSGALAGCTVEVAAGRGRSRLSGPLLRLTTECVTFRLEPGECLEDFLPGRELEAVAIRRGRELLLEGCAAAVRSLAPDHTGGFEAEMTLGSPPSPALPEEAVRDPMQRASLVGEAMRRGRLVMEGADGTPAPTVVKGRVDALAEQLLVDGPPEGFTPGMVVRFGFDSGGAHYRFVSALGEAVAGPSPGLLVSLPREIKGRRRRRTRVAMQPAEATARLVPLLGRESVSRTVIDLEMEGMGFLADPSDLLPLGTRLASIQVTLRDGVVLQASGRIASRTPAQGPGGHAVRCGVHFDPLSAQEQSALAGAIVRRAHPGLELARGLTFDALWCFLRETGFLYPEKEQKIRASLPEVQGTLSTLLSRPDGPLRALVFRSGGVLAGHVSALRAYRSTWMIQHLAVLKDGPGRLDAAKSLNAGVVDYLDQLPDCEWIRIWFRPSNRWPARTFGRFVRLQFDPHRCDLRTYAYLVAPTSGAPTPDPAGVSVASARPADWAEIRRHLVADRQTAALSAEDLCQAPDLSEAGAGFEALGLERRREALVARKGGVLAGFALLEFSSMGLNFSELTNAFRLHALDADPAVTGALAAAARERYRAAGRPIAIGLSEAKDRQGWTAAGFAEVKQYCCVTAHRSLLRRYVEFVQRLYEYLPGKGTRPTA